MSRSKVSVVLGTQWGDEGKGKIVDLLADKMDVVCRCQGGNNAGHTVVVEEIEYNFHLLPSGIVNEQSIALIGCGVVIHLPQLFDEIEQNRRKGLKNIEKRIRISQRAHLVFDFHQTVDGLQEKSKGDKSIGTTKKGIGPAYSTQVDRLGIRVADLIAKDFSIFEQKFRFLVSHFANLYKVEVDIDAELNRYKEYAERIRPCVCQTLIFLEEQIKQGKNILVEGANGALLDNRFGTYPYVTSSVTTIGGVVVGLGIHPTDIGEIYGVCKAYSTRVGDGPFPTELFDENGDYLQTEGKEVGVTTGRIRRCGWLDLFLLKYSHLINKYTAIAITKLDVLDNLKEIKLGVSYKLDDETLDVPPICVEDWSRVKVEYIIMKGWMKNVSSCRKFDDLPSEAKNYILKIEEVSGTRVKWVGVGPDRESIIERF